MAVNFLDEILVKLNGTSSSKKYLQLNGGGGSGSVSGQAGIGFRPLNAGSNVHASIEALENGNASYQTNLTFNTNGSSSDSAPSERMRITSAGNVGIGTTNPSTKLHVSGGDIRIDDTERIEFGSGGVRINNDAAGRMYNRAPLGFYWETNGGYRMVLDSSGRLGIGTTSPSQKLEVIGITKITQSGDALRINSSDANGSYATWQNNGSNIGYIGAGYHLWSSPNNIATSLGIRAQTRLDLGIQGNVHMTILNTGQTRLATYTSTSVATTGSLDPNQNFQASQDTLANLGVDPDGNIVRGDQEGTWTFTKAQLSTSLGQTLISAPGAGKGIVILESNWMVKYAGSGSMSTNQFYDIRQANNVNSAAVISRLPGNKINEIMLASQGTIVNPSYGFYSRDVPTDAGGRTYKANVATTLNRVTSGSPPANLISISIKLKYRIFNGTTF